MMIARGATRIIVSRVGVYCKRQQKHGYPDSSIACWGVRWRAQAAGWFATGSSLPQVMVQHRQRLTYIVEPQLRELVILSR
jgi:hypothetical protein